ncbi:MAG: hypothetical protein ABIL58_25625 [Pseudomonadota bacterium]
MSDFIIQHPCPQCGAPITLAETDRLVSCGFCRVRSYMPQLFIRYLLPHDAPPDKKLIYLPYWRYKGMVYYVTGNGIQHHLLDATRLAVNLSCVPPTMGLRSQAMTLNIVTPDTPGRFVQPDKPFSQVTGLFADLSVPQKGGSVFHQADIGETVSLIYAPFYEDGGLFDAVLNKQLGDTDAAWQVAALPGGAPTWTIKFVPTLCPDCGWDMECASNSLSLLCRNCNSVWRPGRNGLKRTRLTFIVAKEVKDIVYLPFWRIKTDVSGITLNSFADLVRIANLSRAVQPGWERQEFYFWSPAFKVRPETFVQLSRQMNIGQPAVAAGDETVSQAPALPEGRILPVTLPVSDAVESLKISLASFIKPAKYMLPRLPDITITPQSSLLVYLPFHEGSLEYTNDAFGVAINKRLVSLAGNL